MGRLPQGYNLHHTLFTQRLQESQLHSRTWRRHHGMIIPIHMRSHIELHNTVPPLPLPSQELAQLALSHLVALPRGLSRLTSFNSVRRMLWEEGEERGITNELGAEAIHFAQNFDLQAAFFDDSPEAQEMVA